MYRNNALRVLGISVQRLCWALSEGGHTPGWAVFLKGSHLHEFYLVSIRTHLHEKLK